jgi:hypothetical protein
VTESQDGRFDQLKPITGTRSFHQYTPLSQCTISAKTLSSDSNSNVFHIASTSDCECDAQNEHFQSLNESTVKVGNWVLVLYLGNKYPGKVSEINDITKTVTVSALEISGKYFKYPSKEDVLEYPFSDIISVLKEPMLVNMRGLYSIEIDV